MEDQPTQLQNDEPLQIRTVNHMPDAKKGTNRSRHVHQFCCGEIGNTMQ